MTKSVDKTETRQLNDPILSEEATAFRVKLVADYDEEIKSDLKSVESDFVSIEKLKKLGMKKNLNSIKISLLLLVFSRHRHQQQTKNKVPVPSQARY